MFDTVDFREYTEKRKSFYENLSDFRPNEDFICDAIEIDLEFFRRMRPELDWVFRRRLEKAKFFRAENIQYKNQVQKLFPELDVIFEHKGPAIYWFTLDTKNEYSNSQILSTYSDTKSSGTGWWTKVVPARFTSESNVLYLGKVQNALENRFIQHVGLGHDFTTALKLERWLPKLPTLKLTFQFLKIKPERVPFLSDIEKVLWENSTPLLGQKPRF